MGGLEFNPKVTTDEQLLKQRNNSEVHTDSTRTNTLDIHTAEKLERAKRAQNTTNIEVRQTQAQPQNLPQQKRVVQVKNLHNRLNLPK